MSSQKYRWITAAQIGLLAGAMGVSTAHAAPLYWDGADTTANADGGAGTWDNSTANWDDAATGGADAVWTDGQDANFDSTAGSVGIGANIIAGDINFAVAGYTLNVDSGQSLIFSSLSGSSATINADNSVSDTRTVTLDNASDVTWTGDIGSSAFNRLHFVKNGAGTFNFTGTLIADSGLDINAGTVVLNSNIGDGNNSTDTTLSGTAILDLNGHNASVDGVHTSDTTARIVNNGASSAALKLYSSLSQFDGTIEGDIKIQMLNSTAELRLTNTGNTFSGGIEMFGGNLEIVDPDALGTGSLILRGNDTVYSFNGNDLVITNNVDMSQGSGSYTFGENGGTGTLTFAATNNTSLGHRDRTFTTYVDTSIASNYAGDSRDSIVKAGDATLTLKGHSSYNGGTTVNAGTLLAMNTTGSATGDGNVIINAGGRLGGTGFIVLGTGNSVDFSAGGTFLALIDGPLTIDGDIIATDGIIATDDTLTLPEYTVLSFNAGMLSGSFNVDPSISGQGYSVVYGADSVKLVIPEPASIALLAAGIGLIGLPRRR